MAIYDSEMDLSVTEFKHRCLEIVRRVERTDTTVTITRQGRAVAQLEPSIRNEIHAQAPWERLRALGGTLLAPPGESVVRDDDFKALR
ncbi:MAG: type II toxin-antitoxin system Phd/YefM family antitoxin [Acidobacteria bacterium]|nr:type II toxin-antitoxin system Phd/YefM family antitoxin [Acidobacteriota bacterium]